MTFSFFSLVREEDLDPRFQDLPLGTAAADELGTLSILGRGLSFGGGSFEIFSEKAGQAFCVCCSGNPESVVVAAAKF